MRTKILWVSMNYHDNHYRFDICRGVDGYGPERHQVRRYTPMSYSRIWSLVKLINSTRHMQIIPLNRSLDVTAYAPFECTNASVQPLFNINARGKIYFVGPQVKHDTSNP